MQRNRPINKNLKHKNMFTVDKMLRGKWNRNRSFRRRMSKISLFPHCVNRIPPALIIIVMITYHGVHTKQ